MDGEIFPFLCQPAKRPSVQALEIIRHIDASFDLKKSPWDYQYLAHPTLFIVRVHCAGLSESGLSCKVSSLTNLMVDKLSAAATTVCYPVRILASLLFVAPRSGGTGI